MFLNGGTEHLKFHILVNIEKQKNIISLTNYLSLIILALYNTNERQRRN